MKKIYILLFVFFLASIQEVFAEKKNEITIGLLKFGSVNWELDVIKTNNLDEKNGIKIKTKFFANKNAASVALQGNAVDVIVTDWIWVSRQRANKKKFVFYPHSMAVGGIIVHDKSDIGSVEDLRDKKLGIAGSSVDKSWLLFRAYAKKKLGEDAKKIVKPAFAAPPLLNKLIINNEIDAVLNYWHYKARLESKGFREIISVEEILQELGIETRIPAYGWVFHENLAKEKTETLNAFFNSSKEAKKIMISSDTEWERLFELTRANDRTELIYLRNEYREGIPLDFGIREIEETKKTFQILSQLGGVSLVGSAANDISPGTFWKE